MTSTTILEGVRVGKVHAYLRTDPRWDRHGGVLRGSTLCGIAGTFPTTRKRFRTYPELQRCASCWRAAARIEETLGGAS